jgi:ribosomal protein L11 methylase PrmA
VKLGAEFAVGMDNDPASERAFLHNAAINGVEDRAHFVAGSTVDEAVAGCLLAGRPIPALVVCNMLSTEFDDLLAPLRRLRRPMVLGGFLLAEAESVRARLRETGWRVARETTQVEWAAWLCEPDGD